MKILRQIARCCRFMATVLLLASCASTPEESFEAEQLESAVGYEVWAIDQSNSAGRDHGGKLYIFSGSDLHKNEFISIKPVAEIDLAGDTAALCRERDGGTPKHPNSVVFNEDQTRAMVTFLVSGHVVIYDTATRRPLECLPTARIPTGRSGHVAFPSPGGSYVLVANQGGKRLERIDINFKTDAYVHHTTATLNLSTGNTPLGAPLQADRLRPDNVPVCSVITEDGNLAFVTLRGGGLLVVEPRSTPMRIIAEYDMTTVEGYGCGGAQAGQQMYLIAGDDSAVSDQQVGRDSSKLKVYRFPMGEFRSDGALLPNHPAPAVVYEFEGGHDMLKIAVTANGRYLWVVDQLADVIEVFDTADDMYVRSIPLNGVLGGNVALGITESAPDGERMYITLHAPESRGGDAPSLAVLEVLDNGSNGRVVDVLGLASHEDGVGKRADLYGLGVRWKGLIPVELAGSDEMEASEPAAPTKPAQPDEEEGKKKRAGSFHLLTEGFGGPRR